MQEQNLVELKSTHYLLQASHSQSERQRIIAFADWLDENDIDWMMPDLIAYRDYLEDRLSLSSVQAHLSTIKSAYRNFVLSGDQANRIRADIRKQLLDRGETFADAKARIDEWTTMLDNLLKDKQLNVKLTEVQDPDRVRLTLPQRRQFFSLIEANPDIGPSIRDYAMFGLMLSTAVRVEELVNVDVEDIYQTYENQPALLVKQGKGNKSRRIPYGNLYDFIIPKLERWFDFSGITSGAVFRAFWSGNEKVRPNRMNVRSPEYILRQYSIKINGENRILLPHDLRYTCARMWHDAGMPIEGIQRNMGHSSVRVTMGYIGDVNWKDRSTNLDSIV